MVTQGISSRPVYSPLTARPGDLHLCVADAEAASAIIELATSAGSDFCGRARIIYIPRDASGRGFEETLWSLRPQSLYVAPTIAAMLSRLRQELVNAHMGTQLYLAGTEGLIGQAVVLALESGIDHASIQREHRGTTARRLQCVHCKGITEDVRMQPS